MIKKTILKKKVFYLKNKIDKSIDIILPYKGTKGLIFKNLLIRKKFKKIHQIWNHFIFISPFTLTICVFEQILALE